jgi:hypothetical protein
MMKASTIDSIKGFVAARHEGHDVMAILTLETAEYLLEVFERLNSAEAELAAIKASGCSVSKASIKCM